MTRRDVFAVAGGAAALFLEGCGSDEPVIRRGDERTFRMGERVSTGPLIYTVIETEWSAALGNRLPTSKFLQVRLTVSNSGGSERAVPLLELVSQQGQTYQESSDGTGVEEWLGILRNLAGTETQQGRILFDAPQGNYKLRVTDGGDPGSELTSLIDLPLQIQENTPIQAPTSQEQLTGN